MSDLSEALETKSRRPRTVITYEKAAEILTDRYHNGMSVGDIKTKYGISHATWIEVNTKLGDAFKKEKGVKTKKANELNGDDFARYLRGRK